MSRRLKIAVNLLGWSAGLLFLIIFWQQLGETQNWGEIFANIDLKLFSFSFVLLIISNVVRSQLGYISNNFLGYPLSHGLSYRFYAISTMAKYIPGGVWLFAAKTVLYNRNGMPMLVASTAMLWELMAELLAILVVTLVISLSIISLPGYAGYAGLVTIGVLFLILAIFVSQMFWPWRLLARFRLRGADRMLQMLQDLGSNRFTLTVRLTGASSVMWIITGVSFYILLASLGLTESLSLRQAAVIYFVAWTIGFLVFITPAGLGPREAILIGLLIPFFGATTAFSVSLLARLWWALSETVHILVMLCQYTLTASYRRWLN